MKRVFTLFISLCVLLVIHVVNASAQAPVKRVLLEQYTGAWCGWCVDGSVVVEELLELYPDQMIGVKIHQGDGMEVKNTVGTKTTSIMDTLGSFISGYPNGTIDRVMFKGQAKVGVDRGSWKSFVEQQMAKPADVDVQIKNVSFDKATRKITADLEATFVKTASGDIRVNLMVIEDNVTGSGAAYDQSNFLSNRPGYEGNPYFNKPAKITGYEHKSVVRSFLGGVWGMKGIIPAIAATATPYKTTFTYTLPEGYNENNITLVGVVQKYGTASTAKEVLNANEVGLVKSIAKTETVLPNPYLSIAKNNEGNSAITVKNLGSASATVRLEIDTENSTIPAGWSASLEPSEVKLDAGGNASASVKIKTNDKQGYAKVVVKAITEGENVFARTSKGIVYNVTPGMKYAIYGKHERLSLNYGQYLAYKGQEFIDKTINLPIDAELAKAYPPSQFDLALVAVDFGSRGALGGNAGFISSLKSMLDAGGKVMIASGLELYFGLQASSAQTTKDFFQKTIGVSLKNTQPTQRFTSDAQTGTITAVDPFGFAGVTGDYISDGIDTELNKNVEPDIMPFAYYTNEMKLNAGSTAIPIFSFDGETTNIGGVRWENGNARLVLYTFDMDGIENPTIRETIMSRTINWLLMGAMDIKEQENDQLSVNAMPNPFSTHTKIQYTVKGNTSEVISMKMYDVYGNEVYNTGNVHAEPGTHGYTVNAQGLSTGSYRLVITSQSGNAIQMPLMIVK
jgi:hypothetical protein